MGRRRKARETALQFLYQLDVRSSDDPTSQAAEFWSRHSVDPEGRAFVEDLVVGTKQHQGKIDALIAQCAEHWDLERMSAVDRNILRAAVYELLWHPDVPAKVAINEAIEIAKKFGPRNRAGSSTASWTGSRASCARRSEPRAVRYAILSDIHRNLDALQAVLVDAEGRVDALICLGDVVGYGPQPEACLELVAGARGCSRGGESRARCGRPPRPRLVGS